VEKSRLASCVSDGGWAAGAFDAALRAAAVASCGKHFPGYSAAVVDAHHSLPKIDRTREQLDGEELAVFRAFTGSNARQVVDSMMICHGWYPCFETKKTPASLSHRVVTELLREELGFQGLIMTDDLDMGAITQRYGRGEDARRAIEAGNDLALICHRLDTAEAAAKAIATLPDDVLEEAEKRVARFRKKLHGPLKWSEAKWQSTCDAIRDLAAGVPAAPAMEANSPVADY